MKIWPVDREDWSNILLRLPLALLILFALCAMVTDAFIPSSRNGDRYANLIFISTYALYAALITMLLLFAISILFACWKDWRRAFWCSFNIIVWLALIMFT